MLAQHERAREEYARVNKERKKDDLELMEFPDEFVGDLTFWNHKPVRVERECGCVDWDSGGDHDFGYHPCGDGNEMLKKAGIEVANGQCVVLNIEVGVK